MILFGIDCVLFHGFDDESVVAANRIVLCHSAVIVPVFVVHLRDVVYVSSFNVYLYFVLETLDLHYLSFEGGILLHVISVDPVQLGVY